MVCRKRFLSAHFNNVEIEVLLKIIDRQIRNLSDIKFAFYEMAMKQKESVVHSGPWKILATLPVS